MKLSLTIIYILQYQNQSSRTFLVKTIIINLKHTILIVTNPNLHILLNMVRFKKIYYKVVTSNICL